MKPLAELIVDLKILVGRRIGNGKHRAIEPYNAVVATSAEAISKLKLTPQAVYFVAECWMGQDPMALPINDPARREIVSITALTSSGETAAAIASVHRDRNRRIILGPWENCNVADAILLKHFFQRYNELAGSVGPKPI